MLNGCFMCNASRRRFLAMTLGASAAGRTARAQSQRSEGGGTTAKSRNDGVIDFHAHMLDPSLIPEGGEPSVRGREGWLERFTDPAAQIADMDRLGISAHVVGQSNVIQGITWGDAKHDLQVHRQVNDGLAEHWVNAHRGRFIGAFGLPTQSLDLALPELERAVTKLGMKVLQISSSTPDGIYYGDPRLHPLWEAVQHFGVTVFIHPHGQAKAPPLDQFALHNSVGQSIEEAKVMSSIIYQGIFDKFPKVKIVVAHGGGFLPHYYGRIDRNVTNFPSSAVNITRYPSEYLKSFYYDSCVYAPAVLAALIKVVGVDRIVLGGDYPVGVPDPIAILRDTPGLTERDVQSISRHTPASILELR